MTPHEKEIRYLHCFEYACNTLSMLLVKQASVTISLLDNPENKCSIMVAKRTCNAVTKATETLEKSSVASNLPPEQFKEKVLVSASKKLSEWDVLNFVSNEFGQLLSIHDKQWNAQVNYIFIF